MKTILKYHKALCFAAKAHDGQLRKDNETPYIVHPIGVAELVKHFGGDDNQIIAALLHDTVEDCDTSHADILENFGQDVANLVVDLTDVYVKKDYQDLNRAARKTLEAQRLAKISNRAKLVKACDILYNINDCRGMTDGFKHKMLSEKMNNIIAMFGDVDHSWTSGIFQVRKELLDFYKLEL